MSLATYSKLLAASILDTFLTLFLKVLPLFPGSHISYCSRRVQLPGWGDAWRDGETYFVQLGGFEMVLDLPSEGART